MEKYLFIGDSHKSALLPIKIALFLGIPFFMGKGYCSSTDWPNVSRFDGNGNGDGMVMVMLMVSFLLYISSTSPEHFPICVLGTPSTETVQKVGW
jgi:hypothetical protein